MHFIIFNNILLESHKIPYTILCYFGLIDSNDWLRFYECLLKVWIKGTCVENNKHLNWFKPHASCSIWEEFFFWRVVCYTWSHSFYSVLPFFCYIGLHNPFFLWQLAWICYNFYQSAPTKLAGENYFFHSEQVRFFYFLWYIKFLKRNSSSISLSVLYKLLTFYFNICRYIISEPSPVPSSPSAAFSAGHSFAYFFLYF